MPQPALTAPSIRRGPVAPAIVVVAMVLFPVVAGAAGRAVSFPAPGGHTVTALVMEAAQRPAPAVVLVPMLGRSKDDWAMVAQWLADAGITAVAVDLPARVAPESPAALTAWHGNVTAAVNYLRSRSDVRADAIGVAGASLGANLAAVAAAGDARVRALALVSPSLDYRGVRIQGAMREYGGRPALLLASRRDPYAARSVRDLSKEAPGPREAYWSEIAAHGTFLLAQAPDLGRALVEWFRQTLGVN